MRPARRLAVATVGALCTAGIAAAPAHAQLRDPNPCLGSEAQSLLCPDLVMAPPFDLRIDRRTRPGRRLLRAGNSIDSVGAGPAELRGARDGPRTMAAVQRIHRPDGTRANVNTGARLYWKFIPRQGYYWKFNHAARFLLYRLDEADQRQELVLRGPKAVYCLRDLQRRNPLLIASPPRRVYPACNQQFGKQRVTLGTSVGWSDVYPAGYHEQWVDVTGLSGRFELVHVADPRNGIYESNESNNEAGTFVELPSGRAFGRRFAVGTAGDAGGSGGGY